MARGLLDAPSSSIHSITTGCLKPTLHPPSCTLTIDHQITKKPDSVRNPFIKNRITNFCFPVHPFGVSHAFAHDLSGWYPKSTHDHSKPSTFPYYLIIPGRYLLPFGRGIILREISQDWGFAYRCDGAVEYWAVSEEAMLEVREWSGGWYGRLMWILWFVIMLACLWGMAGTMRLLYKVAKVSWISAAMWALVCWLLWRMVGARGKK